MIALLRGINVSGQRMIKMKDLQGLMEALNLRNVRTYLQSGNVIFDDPGSSPNNLGKEIEEMILDRLNLVVPVILRSGDEIMQISGVNPFLSGRNEDITKLCVTFLSEEPSPVSIEKLHAAKAKISSGDEFVLMKKEIYLFCPGGFGNTKFSNGFLENKLMVTATTRNWKTISELAAMARQGQSS